MKLATIGPPPQSRQLSPPLAGGAGAVRRMSLPRGLVTGLGSLLVAALLWELVARLVIRNQLFFVPLLSIGERAVSLWREGELQTDMLVSFTEFAIGFVLSTVVGLAGGVLLASSRALRGFFEPWVTMLYSTPVIALGPLFILWLGIGIASKVAVIFLTAVFPILINTLTGLTTTDRTLIDVARSFGASQTQIYAKIRMPAAVPFILTGLRLGVARALVGVVVAELFGARAGLGFLVMTSSANFDTAALFVAVLILAFTGIVAVELLKLLERRLTPWSRQEASE